VHFEDLGAFAGPLEVAGYRIRYLNAGVDELRAVETETADLLIVLGGPVGAYEGHLYAFLDAEIEALRARLAAGAPTLGVCLGAQLMAVALGARVAPGVKEIGWAPVELTEAGRNGPLRHLDGLPVLHWHGDLFELPPGAERLAATPPCPNQAFALGRNAIGFQFHPEADWPRLRKLVSRPCRRDRCRPRTFGYTIAPGCAPLRRCGGRSRATMPGRMVGGPRVLICRSAVIGGAPALVGWSVP
jgi:GMP synthase (glutamine-hydrolysing)